MPTACMGNTHLLERGNPLVSTRDGSLAWQLGSIPEKNTIIRSLTLWVSVPAGSFLKSPTSSTRITRVFSGTQWVARGVDAVASAFRSVQERSCIAPIRNPANCPRNTKTFNGYLGENKSIWSEHNDIPSSCRSTKALRQ